MRSTARNTRRKLPPGERRQRVVRPAAADQLGDQVREAPDMSPARAACGRRNSPSRCRHGRCRLRAAMYSMWSQTCSSVARGHRARARADMRASSRAGRPAALPQASLMGRYHSRVRLQMKGGTKVAMTIPPLPGTRSSTSSGTLRGWSHSAHALECENTTGARLMSSTWSHHGGDDMGEVDHHAEPVQLQHHARPNGVSPPWRGASVALSTQSSVSLWQSVISRAPAARQTRRGPGCSPARRRPRRR